jgi:chemosensory pili system protein ChpA (sensor histidine kinase/response regulator)
VSTAENLVLASARQHPSLQVAVREIAVELAEARTRLEHFAENTSDTEALASFAGHLHAVRGALRVAEVYGGALLAEEMEQVAEYVREHCGEGRFDEDGLEALVRAMEQLPAYVERVASGGRDVPIALLPLLNDLRAARGGALLSEGTLLMLNLRSDEPARSPAESEPGDAAELARRLRPRFQLAGSAASRSTRTSRLSPRSRPRSSRMLRRSRCSSFGG